MSARFLRGTPLALTEIEMQLIPGFSPRSTGILRSRYKYTGTDCDCQFCTQRTEKKKCCGFAGCICLPERIAGYSGGYKPNGSSWTESIDYGDVYTRLDKMLGLRDESGYHVKYAGKAVEFRLSVLSVNIRNAPLAPSDPKNTQAFLADTSILLEVTVSFGGKSLPPMHINLKVQAKYMPLF